MMRRSLTTVALIALLTKPGIAGSDATLQMCIKHIAHQEQDFADAFSMGPIVVPAGAVFDAAGHAFGPASDPLDWAHMKDKGGWTGVSDQESDRRKALFGSDSYPENNLHTGLITLSEITLTKRHPCAAVPVAAADSPKWGWTTAPVFGSSAIWYQLYGIIKSGQLDGNFKDTNDPLENAAGSGDINGILQGTTNRTIPVA